MYLYSILLLLLSSYTYYLSNILVRGFHVGVACVKYDRLTTQYVDKWCRVLQKICVIYAI